MHYNDDETRKEEERFKEQLEKVRSLTKEDIDALMGNVETLVQTATALKARPSLTAEEAALLERIKLLMEETTKNITDMKLVLGESTRRQAYAYFLHVKKLAEEGNPDAVKVYKDLKPDYLASLRSEMGDN